MSAQAGIHAGARSLRVPPAQAGRVSRWPGLGGWARLHWRGELSLGRTLLVAPVMMLAPSAAGLALGILLGPLLSLDNAVGDRLVDLIVLSFYAGLGWWIWGTHRKSLNLMADGRMVSALLAFLVSVLGVVWMAHLLYSVYEDATKPPSAYARMLAECDRDDRSWVEQGWKVTAMPELNRIVATGSIGQGSAKALEQVLQAHPEIRLLQLDSPGGRVSEGYRLIELVEKHQMDTLVLGRCASACTWVFLAGQRRFVTPDSRFGFHRAGYCGMRTDAPWLTADYMASIYFRERGVQEDFLNAALDTNYYDLWRPIALEVKRGNFATHWWSDRPNEYSGPVHRAHW